MSCQKSKVSAMKTNKRKCAKARKAMKYAHSHNRKKGRK